MSVLARLVARVRDHADQRLRDTIGGLVSNTQRPILETPLIVDGTSGRLSRLEPLRRGLARVSGREMVTALERASRVNQLGLNEVDTTGLPVRRLSALARYGMLGKAAALSDLGSSAGWQRYWPRSTGYS